MKTSRQIFLDKYIAKPIAFVLNIFVRLAGKILSIDHSLDRNFKKIAICKFKGMGSIIQATPMIEAIRNKFPEAEITFITTTANKELIERISLINRIITIDDNKLSSFLATTISALTKLIRLRIEVYIDLEIYSDFSTIFTAFTLAKNRIGFYLRSSSFRMGIYTHMMFFNPRNPIHKIYLQIASLLLCENKNHTLYPLHHNILQSEKVKDYLKSEFVIINPNASDLRIERRWHRDNFIKLINKITSGFPQQKIILIGSPAEQAYTEEIAAYVNKTNVISMAGKTTINELITLIANATIMISNDTGPMHIAFSTNTPTICLFGPCSPQQYEIPENNSVIYKKVYCSPCVHDFEIPPCFGDNKCMQLITPDEVYNAMEELLKNRQMEKISAPLFYKVDDYVLGLVKRK